MLNYILPVLAVILLGVGLRHWRAAPEGLFPAMEWFSFYIAFPALLFNGTARLQLSGGQLRDLALATLLPTLLLAALLAGALMLPFVARRLPRPSRSSVMQGAIRPSSYFGLAVANLLFPPEVVGLTMLALAICLPVLNVIAILALAAWGEGQASLARILAALARNPIILSTLAGLGANLSGLVPTGIAASILDMLGSPALALGLLCVGGGLELRFGNIRPLALLLTSALKLLVLPLMAVLLCRQLGTSAAVAQAACFFAALPAASNAYIMARQMGGDAPLMAGLVTWQALLAAATVPLAVHLPGWVMR